MKYITLTEKDIENAVTYTPIKDKEEFVDYCAVRCINRVSVDLGIEGESSIPYMYMENSFLKSRYLMAALVSLYFCKPESVDTEEGDKWLMTAEQYDDWAGSQVMGQIERIKRKSGPEIQDKIFDFLRDYRDLEKRLTSAIQSNLAIQNDAANRIFLKLALDTSETALSMQKENLEKLKAELDEYINSHKGPEEEAEG